MRSGSPPEAVFLLSQWHHPNGHRQSGGIVHVTRMGQGHIVLYYEGEGSYLSMCTWPGHFNEFRDAD